MQVQILNRPLTTKQLYAKRFTEARLRQGLMHADLSKRSGISLTVVEQSEDGQCIPKLPIVFALARQLGVSPWYLIGRCDDADGASMRIVIEGTPQCQALSEHEEEGIRRFIDQLQHRSRFNMNG